MGSDIGDNWKVISVSDEAYEFLAKNVVAVQDPSKSMSMDNIVIKALYDFILNGHEIKDRMSLFFLKDMVYINDITRPKKIEMDFIEITQRIFCNHHKFLYTPCPHTLWIKSDPQFPKWVNVRHHSNEKPKLELDRYVASSSIRILQSLFDDVMEKRKRLGLYPELSDGDFIMMIALNYY